MEHEPEVNQGCHQPLEVGVGNDPTEGVSDKPRRRQEKRTAGMWCESLGRTATPGDSAVALMAANPNDSKKRNMQSRWGLMANCVC